MNETIARQAFADGRLSPQRRAVLEAVDAIEGAFSVDDLLAAVRSTLPRTATATVYRAVAALLDSGHIAQVGQDAGAALYARCDRYPHHHHAVCEGCGTLVCLTCPLDLARIDTDASGFTVTRHEFRLYGVCDDCSASVS